MSLIYNSKPFSLLKLVSTTSTTEKIETEESDEKTHIETCETTMSRQAGKC